MKAKDKLSFLETTEAGKMAPLKQCCHSRVRKDWVALPTLGGWDGGYGAEWLKNAWYWPLASTCTHTTSHRAEKAFKVSISILQGVSVRKKNQATDLEKIISKHVTKGAFIRIRNSYNLVEHGPIDCFLHKSAAEMSRRQDRKDKGAADTQQHHLRTKHRQEPRDTGSLRHG